MTRGIRLYGLLQVPAASICHWNCHYLLTNLVCRGRVRTPNLKCSNRQLHRRGPIVHLFMVISNFLNFLRELGDFRYRIGKMMLRQLAAAETTQILHAEICWNHHIHRYCRRKLCGIREI